MVLTYRTKRLRSICEDEGFATVEYGPAFSTALKIRLAEIFAATCPSDLLSGYPHLSDNTVIIAVTANASLHLSVVSHMKNRIQFPSMQARRLKLDSIEIVDE